MSEDPTQPLPSGWREQRGRPPPGQATPSGSADPAGSPRRGYRSPDTYPSPGTYGSPAPYDSQNAYGARDAYTREYGSREYPVPGYLPPGNSRPGRSFSPGTNRPPVGGYGGARCPRSRGHRGLTIAGIVVLVLIMLLVAADRVAVAVAENEIASQIKSHGFAVKPNVTITGFPFLNQLAARDFHDVNISARNVPEGPVDIASINATLRGVHLSAGFNGATVDELNGTALITFAALSSATGTGDGITLSDGGGNRVKGTVNLGFLNGTAIFQVRRSGPHQVTVQAISAGGLPVSALGSLPDFTVPIPALPAGMTIQSVSVTGQGIMINIVGHHATLSQ